MIYEIGTEVLDGEKLVEKNVDYTGKEPDCWFRLAMNAFCDVVGGYNAPTVNVREINNFTTEYDIKDWRHSISDGEVEEIDLTVRVTVNPRLTLD